MNSTHAFRVSSTSVAGTESSRVAASTVRDRPPTKAPSKIRCVAAWKTRHFSSRDTTLLSKLLIISRRADSRSRFLLSTCSLWPSIFCKRSLIWLTRILAWARAFSASSRILTSCLPAAAASLARTCSSSLLNCSTFSGFAMRTLVSTRRTARTACCSRRASCFFFGVESSATGAATAATSPEPLAAGIGAPCVEGTAAEVDPAPSRSTRVVSTSPS
mmetsp:Transcript_85649/g.239266  ORF Transcript_85649/g.239266 Transcript_85649/m.239266 type:complete len:217 (+) Transcript_85649:1094-1744(+)